MEKLIRRAETEMQVEAVVVGPVGIRYDKMGSAGDRRLYAV